MNLYFNGTINNLKEWEEIVEKNKSKINEQTNKNILQESLILSSQGKVSSEPKKVVVSSHEYCHIYPGDIRFKVNDCFCKRDNVIWIGRSF